MNNKNKKFNEFWNDFQKKHSLAYNYGEIAYITWYGCKTEMLKMLEKQVGNPHLSDKEILHNFVKELDKL